MSCLAPPPIGLEVDRRCPRCGATAALHGKVRRAVHDWETTFVECERLRCCSRTFTAAPAGLTPRWRYSDRVVGLARVLVAVGASVRRAAHLLRRVGVPVTPQAVGRWCHGVTRRPAAELRLATAPEGDVCLILRPGLWLVIRTPEPLLAERFLAHELGALPTARSG